jgi:hypothetical protein
MYQISVITLQEKAILDNLVQIIHDSKTNGTAAELLVKQIGELSVQYDNLNFSKATDDGDLTGLVLAISLRSAQWWAANPTAATLDGVVQERVAPWVATDAAGALLGATVSAWTQYAQSGDVSLGRVASGAVVAAVSASTGLVGKMAKGITRFFGW